MGGEVVRPTPPERSTPSPCLSHYSLVLLSRAYSLPTLCHAPLVPLASTWSSGVGGWGKSLELRAVEGAASRPRVHRERRAGRQPGQPSPTELLSARTGRPIDRHFCPFELCLRNVLQHPSAEHLGAIVRCDAILQRRWRSGCSLPARCHALVRGESRAVWNNIEFIWAVRS